MELQNGSSSIRLGSDTEHDFARHQRSGSYDGLVKPLIPILDKKEIIKLALIAAALSLVASLPLNFIKF